MTVQGATTCTMILLGILGITSFLAYGWAQTNPGLATGTMIGGLILGLVLGLIMCFKPATSPWLAPVYAAGEGFFVGGISAFYAAKVAGTKLGGATGEMIVLSAATLTFSILFALLLAYKSRLIKPTQNFKLGVVAATGGICMFYLGSMVLRMFGVDLAVLRSGWIGIGISAFIVVIASLNLVLDFDFIEKGEEQKAPKYMEWYAAFGLLVTLVWLYLEILRLLSMLARRN